MINKKKLITKTIKNGINLMKLIFMKFGYILIDMKWRIEFMKQENLTGLIKI